jgi:excisionase family DNA binding protein
VNRFWDKSVYIKQETYDRGEIQEVVSNVFKIAGKRFVTAATLAKTVGVHKRTVLAWASKRGLPVISVGHLRLFDLDEVSDWLEKQKQ